MVALYKEDDACDGSSEVGVDEVVEELNLVLQDFVDPCWLKLASMVCELLATRPEADGAFPNIPGLSEAFGGTFDNVTSVARLRTSYAVNLLAYMMQFGVVQFEGAANFKNSTVVSILSKREVSRSQASPQVTLGHSPW